MARNSNDRSNSNRGGSDRPMMGGWVDTAKDRPLATAAAAAAAVGAGVFLWSRRNQITDQLGHMSDQISQWSENMRSQQGGSSTQSGGFSGSPMGSESTRQPEMAGAGTSSASSSTRATGGRGGKAQQGQTMSPSRTTSPTPGM